jgi:hypothetical protein
MTTVKVSYRKQMRVKKTETTNSDLMFISTQSTLTLQVNSIVTISKTNSSYFYYRQTNDLLVKSVNKQNQYPSVRGLIIVCIISASDSGTANATIRGLTKIHKVIQTIKKWIVDSKIACLKALAFISITLKGIF